VLDIQILTSSYMGKPYGMPVTSSRRGPGPHQHYDLKILLNLNFHHLGYFGAVVQHGGIHAAARALCISPATIGGQIKQLETSLGSALFARRGQRLIPTRFGEQVYRFVSEWFAIGQRLVDSLHVSSPDEQPPLHIGIADGVPLLVSSHLLAPALGDGGRLICCSGRHDDLMDSLTHHRLDLVLTDRPPASGSAAAEIRWIEPSAIAWCATAALAEQLNGELPHALHGAPVVLPTVGTAMRASIDAWLSLHGITPRIVAECEDSALVKALASEGGAAFPVPAMVVAQVCRQYSVRTLGNMPGMTERYLIIALKRRQLPRSAELILQRQPSR
jgi:LysR family transcriptional activator of nhaA